jgi:hypothetical protein
VTNQSCAGNRGYAVEALRGAQFSGAAAALAKALAAA